MDNGSLATMIPIVAIICFAAVKIARIYAAGPRSTSGGDLPARLEALESQVDALRQELSETTERVDFAERLLAKGNEGRPLGPS
jgi:hypothetical protein